MELLSHEHSEHTFSSNVGIVMIVVLMQDAGTWNPSREVHKMQDFLISVR